MVIQKTLDGTQNWTYDYVPGNTSSCSTTQHYVQVTNPLGNITRHYYHGYGASSQAEVWQAGLPEKRVFYGTSVSNPPLRTVEFFYEPYCYSLSSEDVDPRTNSTEPPQTALLNERRVTLHGSPNKTARTEYQYDYPAGCTSTVGNHRDYGNPELVKEYAFDGSLQRQTEFVYEQNDSDGNDATFRAANIVTLFSKKTIKTASGTRFAETVRDYFSSAGSTGYLGQLKQERNWYDTLSGDNSTSGAVVTDYQYWTTFNAFDGSGGKGNLKLRTVQGAPDKYRNYTWQWAVLQSLYFNNQTSTAIFTRSIDEDTGLIAWQRNANGHQTNFDYDAFGRLTSLDPPGSDLSTVISYDTANQATVTQGSSQARFTYDSQGRLQKSRLPGSSKKYR